MTASSPRRSPTREPASRSLVLRVVAALALAVSAYVHADLASGPLVAAGQITLAGMFVGQAVVAALVAAWVLARGTSWAWLAAGAVGLTSLAALVLSVYVNVPAIGPFPSMYEPFWSADKVIAAAAAATAAAVALVALLVPRLRRR